MCIYIYIYTRTHTSTYRYRYVERYVTMSFSDDFSFKDSLTEEVTMPKSLGKVKILKGSGICGGFLKWEYPKMDGL